MKNKPQFPIFIVSKGRSKNALTMRALERMECDYRIIVEPNEVEEYSIAFGDDKVIELDMKFKEDYDTFWPISSVGGRTGPGAARNYAWHIAKKEGFTHHWVMDDNLDAFHRMTKNEKWECENQAIFRAMEDFSLRYRNVAISGPNYYSFAKQTDKLPPFIINTRIYSCLLIRNDLPIRWRGTYNEDTDLCIRVMKKGFCTIQFNAFLQGKVTTQRMKGGNTDEFYGIEGTYNKSKMLEDMHPDIAKVVWKFNRWHHSVDYRAFKQELEFIDGFRYDNEMNEYGLSLINVTKKGN